MSDVIVRLDAADVQIGSQLVLRQTSFTGEAGALIRIRGANGSGKTSLLRALCGLVFPIAGQRTGPQTCAYVPAAVDPPLIKAGRWIDSMPRANRQSVRAALDVLGFHGRLNERCTTLSFGNLRKLLLAEALASGEKLIVLDEAFMGLDQKGTEGLSQLIDQNLKARACVVVAEQDSTPVPNVSLTYVLKDGGLSSDATRASPQSLHLVGDAPHLASVREYAISLGVHVAEDPPA